MKADNLRRVYFHRRRPCWLCSRQLHKLEGRVEHKGMYVGVAILGHDNIYHVAHVECARDPEHTPSFKRFAYEGESDDRSDNHDDSANGKYDVLDCGPRCGPRIVTQADDSEEVI